MAACAWWPRARAKRLETLLAQLRVGPHGAAVSSVDDQWLPASGSFARFDIRSGGHPGD